ARQYPERSARRKETSPQMPTPRFRNPLAAGLNWHSQNPPRTRLQMASESENESQASAPECEAPANSIGAARAAAETLPHGANPRPEAARSSFSWFRSRYRHTLLLCSPKHPVERTVNFNPAACRIERSHGPGLHIGRPLCPADEQRRINSFFRAHHQAAQAKPVGRNLICGVLRHFRRKVAIREPRAL